MKLRPLDLCSANLYFGWTCSDGDVITYSGKGSALKSFSYVRPNMSKSIWATDPPTSLTLPKEFI